ncbi:MAG: biotin/lipoyl-containing protein [Anaerotardibacter sp.]
MNEGETVCLIEAMKLFNEVPSPCSGTHALSWLHK